MSLPIQNYHSYEHYVENLERAETYYTKVLGYKTIGRSTKAAEAQNGMKRLVLAGGKTIHVILSAPLQPWSVAGMYLEQHPEGIGFLNFRVSDIQKTIRLLTARSATFLYDMQSITDDHGTIHEIAIATALDDVGYRFIEDKEYQSFGPLFEMTQPAGSYVSPLGFECLDHMTCNVKTMQPLMAFYKEVMGFEEFWRIDFHTNDVNPNLPVGSGLKSIVVWHPESGIKFANNEPARPYFRNSQIDIYLRDNRGSGVQHVALRVGNILSTMQTLEHSGGKFLAAPQAYYEKVPARMKQSGFEGDIAEDFHDLAEHSILVDGSEKGYLLQIFSHELGRQFGSDRGGPLFYEIIQREGDDGFGGGNFRALFETIEIDQIALAKTATQLPLELI